MKLLRRCLLMKKKDFSSITTTVQRKVLVWGEAIVSGTMAIMRWPFGSSFAVVKVSVKRSSWRGRLRSGSRGILPVLGVLLNLWLHEIRSQGSGMWLHEIRSPALIGLFRAMCCLFSRLNLIFSLSILLQQRCVLTPKRVKLVASKEFKLTLRLVVW